MYERARRTARDTVQPTTIIIILGAASQGAHAGAVSTRYDINYYTVSIEITKSVKYRTDATPS